VGSRAGLGAVVKRKFPALPGLELPIIQPVAQRYNAELPRRLTHKKNNYKDKKMCTKNKTFTTAAASINFKIIH
jgi:hypothetical protein